MSFKDILALILSAEDDDAVLRAGETLSARFEAHLAATFLTALPDEPLAYEPSAVAGIWAEMLTRARFDAQAGKRALEVRAAGLGRPCEIRAAEALSRDLGRTAALHARYADLAVMRRPDGDRDPRHDLVEGVLFHAGRPALIIPPQWNGERIGARPILAWDASREATRALSDATALLHGAEIVTIVTVDAQPKTFGHGEHPGADIAAHLARRGLATQIRNLASGGQSTAEALLSEATAINADLIVMGGYAHARLREMLFGGATRDVLQSSAVPLLMAH